MITPSRILLRTRSASEEVVEKIKINFFIPLFCLKRIVPIVRQCRRNSRPGYVTDDNITLRREDALCMSE